VRYASHLVYHALLDLAEQLRAVFLLLLLVEADQLAAERLGHFLDGVAEGRGIDL
jgi:hypothetical protein